jgi:Ca-activated chloride channel homolog
MQRRPNYYHQLGLSREATPEEIKRAYHEAVLRLHPDVNVNPGDTELFIDIQQAYEVLSDPERRVEYDNKLPPEEGKLPLNLQVLYSCPFLRRSNEMQLIYAFLSLSPANGLNSHSSIPLNVCLVLDRSTSMQGERLDTVKATAIKIFRQLRDKGNLSIVTFSDRAEVLLPAGSRREMWEVESAIHLIHPSGGTEIYQGLMTAMAEVYRFLDSSALNHIILVTDGRTYGDEEASLELANIAASQGIAITCLGIGSEWNDEFLDKLAATTGGSCHFASEGDEIGKNLEDIFLNLSQAYVSDVSLHGKTNLNVELNCAFRLQPNVGELLGHDPIQLGSIPINGSLDILLEFLIHPEPKDNDRNNLLNGRINFKYSQNPQSLTSLYVNLSRPYSANSSNESPPDAIVKAVERLTLYRMQESAYQEIYDGDPEPAADRLEYLASRLNSLGEEHLSQTILDEVSNIKKGLSISASSKKRIKYGTRSLLLSTGRNSPMT